MSIIRIGVVGVGNMGSVHCAYMKDVPGAELAAVCDIDPARREKLAGEFKVPGFATHRELLASRTCDAVVIAVPHYDHASIALDALASGLHVMCEKPLCVSVKAARHLVSEYESKYRHLKFGIMFQQRTTPVYRKLRELIAAGELGEIRRITWIVTDWFRSCAYYASGGWRATWAGEGGGVLINQCPHNLDLIQWITGMMPRRVVAQATIGRFHPIEVEDDVHAMMFYDNGAVGHFITTTGESPGTNRLEIAADRGKVVVEFGELKWWRTRVPVQEFNETTPEPFAWPERWQITVPISPPPAQPHVEVLRAFVKSIQTGSPMVAEGVEGVRGLELGNAMLMAGLTQQPVDLPVDGEKFDALLAELASKHAGRKTLETRATAADMSASFQS